MKKGNKLSLILLGFLFSLSSVYSQRDWSCDIKLSSLDCDKKAVCYQLELKGVGDASWGLGDQNYRLFYDAENVSVVSVNSLLPEGLYGSAQIEEELKLINSGQEDYSPLDEIDGHLGFLDFSIMSYTKDRPARSVKITNDSEVSVAEICLEVSEELLEGGRTEGLHLYLSRGETAGSITNQYTVLTANTGYHRTESTRGVSYGDITPASGSSSRLSELCRVSSTDNSFDNSGEESFHIYPNPVSTGGVLNYETEDSDLGLHTIKIYDLTNRLLALYEDLPSENRLISLKNTIVSGNYIIELKSGEKIIQRSLSVIRE